MSETVAEKIVLSAEYRVKTVESDGRTWVSGGQFFPEFCPKTGVSPPLAELCPRPEKGLSKR